MRVGLIQVLFNRYSAEGEGLVEADLPQGLPDR